MDNNDVLMNENEIEIDLLELLQVVRDHLAGIILTTLACALAMFLAVQLLITPTYASNTKLYVLPKSTDATNVTNTELQAGTLLTSDYVELVQSREVTEAVIAQLGLKDADGNYLTHEALSRMIDVSVQSNTRVINIRITDTDPYRAHDIAEAVRIVAAQHIKNVMDFEAVNVVDEADTPTKQASPNKKRMALIGALLGLILSLAVVIIRHLMDDTIKTEEDVQRYLGVSTLGLIPLQEGEKSGKSRTKKKRAKRSKRKGEK